MFQFFFKYPSSMFTKGHLILLGGWSRWMLGVLLLAAAAGLALSIGLRMSQAAPRLRSWRIGVIWLLQSSLLALLLILLWRPAVSVAELKPHQNIIAVVVDDSHSMAMSEDGATRQGQAIQVLHGGVLAALQKKFQTRLYRLDRHLGRISGLEELSASAPVTRIGDSLKQLADETAGLPIGAIVLLSDGADNSGGIGLETISALRDRRIPVHTVGFGREQVPFDVEMEDANVASRTLANSRLAATVSFRQRGYAGR